MLLLLFTVLVSPAQAWEVLWSSSGEALRWTEMPIRWTYDDAEAPKHLNRGQKIKAVREAFEVWTHIEGADIRFEEIPSNHAAAQDDGVNRVYWVEDWQWDPNLLALTSTWARSNGEIVAFEIRINASYPSWTTDGKQDAMDLQNTMAHEVGHALALDHSPHEAEATMFPTARMGEIHKRELHPDDMEGARFLYGRGLAVDQAGVGCHTVATANTALGALSVPVLLLFMRREGRCP